MHWMTIRGRHCLPLLFISFLMQPALFSMDSSEDDSFWPLDPAYDFNTLDPMGQLDGKDPWGDSGVPFSSRTDSSRQISQIQPETTAEAEAFAFMDEFGNEEEISLDSPPSPPPGPRTGPQQRQQGSRTVPSGLGPPSSFLDAIAFMQNTPNPAFTPQEPPAPMQPKRITIPPTGPMPFMPPREDFIPPKTIPSRKGQVSFSIDPNQLFYQAEDGSMRLPTSFGIPLPGYPKPPLLGPPPKTTPRRRRDSSRRDSSRRDSSRRDSSRRNSSRRAPPAARTGPGQRGFRTFQSQQPKQKDFLFF